MMILGELRQHPDYPKLVAGVQKMVDNYAESVLGAAKHDDLSEIRKVAGGHEALRFLLTDLTTKER